MRERRNNVSRRERGYEGRGMRKVIDLNVTLRRRKRLNFLSFVSTVLSKLAIYRTVLDKFLGWVESLVWGKTVGRFLNSIYPVYQKRGSKSQKRFQIDSKLKASVSRRKTISNKEKNWAGRGWGGVLIKVEGKVRRTGPHYFAITPTWVPNDRFLAIL